MKKHLPVVSVLLIIFTHFTFSQNSTKIVPHDSIINKSYEEIYALFNSYESKGDIEKAALYARAYLVKGKRENNNYRVANAYSQLVYLEKDNHLALKYTDSILDYVKGIEDSIYPALPYLQKGIIYYDLRDHKKSLDYTLKAYKYTQQYYNEELNYYLLELLEGFYIEQEAYDKYLELAKSNLDFYLRKGKSLRLSLDIYYNSLHSVSNAFLALNQPDSALHYAKKGLKDCFKLNNHFPCYHLMSIVGQAEYKKNNFRASEEIINSVISKLEGRPLGILYYYKAKIFKELKQPDSMVYYLKKSDSVIEASNDPFNELLDGYKELITYYKNKNNKQEQLKYINKYIYLDSLLDSNKQFLDKKIREDYEIPKMLKEKEQIIASLKVQQQQSVLLKYILIVVLLLFSIAALYTYYKKTLYKKRFNEFLAKQSKKEIAERNKTTKNALPDIPEEKINAILNDLEKFEQNKEYLNKISLATLAKMLNTNSSYLSKIINTYKEKSFSQYINDLRVTYVINRLQNDATFRLYSVKAIAEEAGYNNVESFSKAFFKKTGVYPSYFIKKINEQL